MINATVYKVVLVVLLFLLKIIIIESNKGILYTEICSKLDDYGYYGILGGRSVCL